MSAWANGGLVDDDRVFSAHDRGATLGDGLFETVLVVDGAPAFFKEHMTRLRDGAAQLDIPVPYSNDVIHDALSDLFAARGRPPRAALRITLTRGTGPRGHAPPPPEDMKPALIASLTPLGAPSTAARRATISAIRRNDASPASRLKTLAYLDNLLALKSAREKGFDEAVLLNTQGRVACACAANVFLIDGETLATPPVSDGVLPGVVRGTLLDLAPSVGLLPQERALAPRDLERGLVFTTNSLTGLCALSLRDGAKTESPPLDRLREAYQNTLAANLAAAARRSV